jgi:hypothetical protein
MADINIKAKIEVDTKGAEDDIEKARKGIKGTGDAIDKTSDAAKKGGGAFASLGSALKGLGILTAIEAAFGLFKETLGKNQKVADAMSTAMNFLSIAFNDLFSYISKNIGNIVGWFKSIFENPVKSLKDFGDAIQDNLIERFDSFLDTIGYLGTALKSLFTGDFAGAIDAVKKAGTEALDIMTGINNTADKVGKVVDSVVKYTSSTLAAAAAQTKLQNVAKLSEAQLEGLIEKYDRQAEIQRQIRDDETNSIDVRIKANDELGKVLVKQQKSMLDLADQRIKSSEYDLSLNKGNIDLTNAVTRAITARQGVLAQITGLESEQKVNGVALAKEQIQMNVSLAESQNQIYLNRKKALADLVIDEYKKLQAQKAARDEERKIELERLQTNINNTNVGTQARVDAQIAYNTKKAELDLADIQYIKAIADLNRKSLTDEQAINEAKLASQLQLAQATGQIFGQLSGLFGQNTAASKAAALAEIAIGTGVGYIQGLDIAQKGAKGTGAAAPFAFPIFYATQIAAVLGAANKARQILTQVRGGGSGTSPSDPSISTPSPLNPALNMQGTQLNTASIQGIGNAAAGGVNRAFILEADINNTTERQFRLQRAARLG